MKIKRKELVDVLLKIKPGLSDKAIIDQTDHFIFDQGYVRTYNDKIAISYPFKMENACFAIKANEFFKLMNDLDAAEVDFEFVENQVNIISGETKGWVVLDSEIKCPMILAPKRGWKDLPEGFIEGIRFCSFSADKNMLDIRLTCLWVTEDSIVSSDNYRASRYFMASKIEDPFLLPAVMVSDLANHVPKKYFIDESWIHFQNKDGVIFSCRAVAGEYFDNIWDHFKVEGAEVLLPKKLIEGVKRARIFVDTNPNGEGSIFIDVKDKKMICKGVGALGGTEDGYDIAYDKNFQLKVSAESLEAILPKTDKMIVGENSILFYADNFEHVISTY